MTNPDPRRERNAICTDGLIEGWIGGEWEASPCIGCAGCAPHRYRAPAPCLGAAIAARATADRAWIAAQAARVRRQRAVAPMRFRAS